MCGKVVSPEEVLSFWLDECAPSDWYKADPAFDALISDRFLASWQAAVEGAFSLWLTHPSGALAYIILTDQFPRNMFRGEGTAFSSDALSLAAAKVAIEHGWDMRIDEPARQFFYLPLMHSENLQNQDRAVRLLYSRMPQTGHNNHDHARAHRYVIREFGRFPYRNSALDRRTTEAEQVFLDSGGYGAALRIVQKETEARAD